MQSSYSALFVCSLILCASSTAIGQTAPVDGPQARIMQAVSDNETLTLRGNVHPAVYQATESLPAEPGTMMEGLVLYLEASPAQEAELSELIAEQSDPSSQNYHKYLTPQEFAARYGASATDIATVTTWLERHGLSVEEVPAGNRAIVFRGSVEQVGEAFKTEIRQYTYRGARYLANASDPQIPAAFAGVVGGVVKLHGFQYEPLYVRTAQGYPVQASKPQYAPDGATWLVPGDYYIIYDINPLLNSGITGTGQSIAVIARSNIYVSDVQTFRSMFGLKTNNPQIVITNSDPGEVSGDNTETTLDTEWSGAVAPGATIDVIVSSSGPTRDGIDLSSIYAVNQNVAPIITLSYGLCEAAMGTTEQGFYNSLWQQASAQGQTVLVAAGDSGAAGCDSASESKGTNGRAVNGLCSSPYSTCVGGTEFVEGSTPAEYWFPSNPGSTAASAMGYIPEEVWNQSGSSSGGSGLWAGGGGASSVYPKPAWQTGTGVPNDRMRDVPDVSLTAATHDGYTIVQGGSSASVFAVGGTSAATPSFAGIMALVDEKNNAAQGNINSILYKLAALKANNEGSIFHDVTSGNNSVPGVTGYAATTGFDLASGWGSVDASLLATLWNTELKQPAELTVFASAVSLNRGQSVTTPITTVVNGLNSAVNLAVSGAPSGVTATLSAAKIASPGAGSVTLTVAAASSATPGVYTLTITASAGSQTATTTIDVTITAATFTLSYSGGANPTLSFGPVTPYVAQKVTLQTVPANGFNSSIAFSATGMPAGITVSFSPASVSGSSTESTVATVSAASTVKGGSYSFTISASGGGVTQTATYAVTVLVQPSCTLTPDQSSVSFQAGSGATFNLTCAAAKASTTAVSLSLAGLPSGATGKFSAATVTPAGTVTLTLSSSSAVKSGLYPLTVTGSEADGATQTLGLYAAISTPEFSVSANPATVTAYVGSTTQLTAVVTPSAGFSSAVAVSISGLPSGVSATIGSNSVANPSSVITLTIGQSAVPGSYPVTVAAAAGSGFKRTATATLTVAAVPVCKLAASPTSLKLVQGKTISTKLTCTVQSGAFAAPLTLAISGLSKGVTGQFSPATLTAGSSTTLTLSATATAAVGNATVSVTATGTDYTQTIPLTLAVAQ